MVSACEMRPRIRKLTVPSHAASACCEGLPMVTGASRKTRCRRVAGRRRRPGRRAGGSAWVWTVDDEAEMERLLDLGADGIMTDRVTALKNVFQRRGLWR